MRKGEKTWVIRHAPTGLEVVYRHLSPFSTTLLDFALRPPGQGSQAWRDGQLAARLEAARDLGLPLTDFVLVRYETIETVELDGVPESNSLPTPDELLAVQIERRKIANWLQDNASGLAQHRHKTDAELITWIAAAVACGAHAEPERIS